MTVPEFIIYDEIYLQIRDLKLSDIIAKMQKALNDGAEGIFINGGKIVLYREFKDGEKREYEIKALEKRLKEIKTNDGN